MIPSAPRKVLVIMLRRIGDVLLTTPAVRALKKIFPEAKIDFLVEKPGNQVLEGNPDIDSILLHEKTLGTMSRLRRERYDWVIDYLGNPRSALLARASGAPLRAGPERAAHRWAYTHLLRESGERCYSALEKIRVLRSLGLDPDETDFLPSLALEPRFERWADEALSRLGLRGPRGLGGSPLVGFVPASRRETRRWPAASFAALGRRLREAQGADLLVFWGPGDRELASEVRGGIGAGAHLSPETRDLRELAALLGRCRLVVTNCNGPKHLAAARGTPTLTIHGSSDPRCWNPPDPERHPVARLESLHCIGCQLNSCPYGLECLRQLPPEAVFAQARELLLRLPAGGRR